MINRPATRSVRARVWSRRLAAVALLALFGAGVSRSGLSAILRAATVDALQYMKTLGAATFSLADGGFSQPRGVAYDAAGRLYVSDTFWFPDEGDKISNRVQVFAPTTHQYLYTLATNDGSEFSSPVGIAIDAEGKILVADGWNDRIVLFSAFTQSSLPVQMGSFGESGNYDPLDPDGNPGPAPLDPLVFSFPTGIAIKSGTILLSGDTAGRVAVVDNSNHRVVVLSSNLTPLYAFGGHAPGELDNLPESMEYPWGVAIDAAGLFYVADADNSRVQVFREVLGADGKPKAQFVRMFGSAQDPATGQFGSQPGDISRPYGLNFDLQGRLWVNDRERHRLLRIDVTRDVDPAALPACVDATLNGQRCRIATSDNQTYEAIVLGANGIGPGLFWYPSGVAVAPSGEVAVADSQNHGVQIFKSPSLGLSFDNAGTIAPGPGPHAVSVLVPFSVGLKNDGVLPLSVSLSPTARNPAGAPFLGQFGGTLSGTIAVGETKSFGMTFTPAQSGSFSIRVAASGEAAVIIGGHVDGGSLTLTGGTVPPVIGLTVIPAVLTAGGAPLALGSVNETVTLRVQLTNTGGTTLTNVLPVISVTTVEGNATAQAVGAPVPLTLGGLESVQRSYQYKLLAPGKVIFQVSVTADYTDPANNVAKHLPAVTASAPLTISADAIAPATVATLFPATPASGWYNAPVTVNLTATDNDGGSGVASVQYMVVAANQWQSPIGNPVEFPVSDQGITTVKFHATDLAGNLEKPDKSIQFKVDMVPPDPGLPLLSPERPASGWYRVNPTITFQAGDSAGGSGVASFDPLSVVTITDNGANQTRTAVAIDKAGNRSTVMSATVNVDKIAPVPLCTADRAPNRRGWYSGNVTVTCTASDLPMYSGMESLRVICAPGTNEAVSTTRGADGSIVASCTYSTDGQFAFKAAATDVAGNVGAAAPLTIKLDKTTPTLNCTTISMGELWPPNHKMVPWNVKVEVLEANLGGSGFTLTGITSSEPTNGQGDGNTSTFDKDMSGWAVGTPDVSGLVRSERSGLGTGRLYQLFYAATDLAGNTGTCVNVLTLVPHDQGKK